VILEPNNPYINWVTKATFLNNKQLETKEFLLKALTNSIEHSPCGLIYELCLAAGVEDQRAEVAASAVELLYCACSLCDDVQDGDAQYVSSDVSIQVNTLTQMLCLGLERVSQVSLMLPVFFSKSGSKALSGQYLEIKKPDWDESLYKRVAFDIAGRLFGEYLRIVAVAAEMNSNSYVEIGQIFGMLLQLTVDVLHKDDRLLKLNVESLFNWGRTMYRQLEIEVKDKKEFLPLYVRLRGLYEQCKWMQWS
jgi:geranylgeranyl pyrophosphate synthase